jgi:hypothetical protein
MPLNKTQFAHFFIKVKVYGSIDLMGQCLEIFLHGTVPQGFTYVIGQCHQYFTYLG